MEADQFVGTWRLVSWALRDAVGQLSYPFGQDAVGYIMYTADGYMSAIITRPNRPHFAAGDILGGTVEEQALASVTCIAYAGPYTVQEGKVVHRVEVSLVFARIKGGQSAG